MNREHVSSRPPSAYAYKVDKCRCYRCARARGMYEAERARRIAAGTWKPFVDAAPVREHLLYLRANGVGLRRVEELTGIARASLSLIIEGYTGRNRRKKVRPETSLLVLALQPGIDTVSDNVPMDACSTVRRIHALVATGYPHAYLAARLGMAPSNFGAVAKSARVTGKTARSVRDLYDELTGKRPEDMGIPARSILRARHHAEKRGWPKPLNWDDDEIENPNAQPRYGEPDSGKMHRSRQLIEDMQFVLDTTVVDLANRREREQVAARLGIGMNYLDKLLKQAQQPASHQLDGTHDSAARAGEQVGVGEAAAAPGAADSGEADRARGCHIRQRGRVERRPVGAQVGG